MTLLEAVILGIVQGLTEFLPISSTAHLRIVPELLWGHDAGPEFTAVIQLGTLAAVIVYFRQEIASIAKAWFAETLRGQFCRSQPAKLGWLMILATFPIVVVGLAFSKQIKNDWRSLYVIAAALIGVGIIMALAELYSRWRARQGYSGRELADVSWRDAIVVGLAQAVALVPGSSRSGTTITGALFCGLNREAAARFSFLLSLPAIFAAAVKEIWDLYRSNAVATVSYGWQELALCTLVSGLVGFAAIAFLLRYLRTHTTYVFVIYRIALGLFLLWGLHAQWLK